MKFVLLSQKPHLYSTKRLFEAARFKGHAVLVMDTLSCQLIVSESGPRIHYRGEDITGFDAVIPRIGASTTYYGIAVLRQFELMGVYCLNDSESVARSRDKLRCLQILSKNGIRIPATCFSYIPSFSQAVTNTLKGPPIVVKLTEGTQGLGVMLAESFESAESIIEAFGTLQAPVLAQEYINESKGLDIRCFVVGKRVVAAMERRSSDGDFRSNIHRGGSGKNVKLSSDEESVAVKAAEVMGLSVAGVDLLRSSRGPLVVEVNSSPGLEGIEEASGTGIAENIIDFIEEEVGRRTS